MILLYPSCWPAFFVMPEIYEYWLIDWWFISCSPNIGPVAQVQWNQFVYLAHCRSHKFVQMHCFTCLEPRHSRSHLVWFPRGIISANQTLGEISPNVARATPKALRQASKLCGRPPQYARAPASWPLTFWPWKWCPRPTHVWRGLPLCQFSSS